MEEEYSLENAKKYIKDCFIKQGDFLILPNDEPMVIHSFLVPLPL